MNNNDLISRSALLEEFKEPGFLMSAIIRFTIEKAPAVDAEPVRHGRWEHGIQCPYCGQVDLAKPNYCCNCGAKMDAEVQDG